MDDDFPDNHLVQISNEDTRKDSRFRLDILSYCDLVEFNFIFIFSIMTISLITLIGFHHYGIGENSIYFNEDPNITQVGISPITIIPYSGFFRIYFQVVQNKKTNKKENLIIDMVTIKNHLNVQKETRNKHKFNSIIYFNEKSTISSPTTLASSHDTSNFSIGFSIIMKPDVNDKKLIISWEFGSKSTVIFSFILKFLFLIISIIILLLVLWSHYYSDFIWSRNFEISAILWIACFFNSFFYSYQIDSIIYFILSFLTTASFKILVKLSIIYYISSVRMHRNSDSRGFEDKFASFGYLFYSILEGISVFLTSIAMFSYDQLGSELLGMKIEFYLNILFIAFITTEFIQSKSLIEDQEKLNLIAYFSLSLIFIIENILVQYFIAVKNIYFCQQAGNNINYASSCIFIFLLLFYNWPIDDDYEIYYQPNIEVDGELM